MVFLLLACSEPDTVKVVAAPQSRASYLTLADGQLDTAHPGIYERPCGPAPQQQFKGSSGCVDLRFYVFPVRADQGPISAWVSCKKAVSVGACKAFLSSQAAFSGRVVSRYGGRDSGWQKAMAAGLRDHKLSAVGNAPVIEIKDPG